MSTLEMLLAMQACVMPCPSPDGRRRREYTVTADVPGPGTGMVIVRCGPSPAQLEEAITAAYARWLKATRGVVS